jgi:excisionase family DNA binding protein
MSQKLMTLSQVAGSLNCTVSAVRRWRRENRIATVKIGRLVRVAESEVDRIGREGLSPTGKGVRK